MTRPWLSRRMRPSLMEPVTAANSSLRRRSSSSWPEICLCCCSTRVRSGLSSSYASFSRGLSRSMALSGPTMRFESRLASQPESSRASTSMSTSGWIMPKSSAGRV